MILALALMMFSPCAFPEKPEHFQVHFCHGEAFVWLGPDTPIWRYMKPYKAGASSCDLSEHFHARSMDTSQPDVKGAPLPKADGRCHSDKNDAVRGGL